MRLSLSKDQFDRRLNGREAVSSVDDFCEKYFSGSSLEWVVRLRQRAQWMLKHVLGPEVLDVGCGSGLLTVLLAKEARVLQVTGVDLCQRAIAITTSNLKRYLTGEEIQKVSLWKAWAETLPFVDNTIDTVILGEVLEHVLDDTAAILEAYRILRPGGRIIVSVPLDGALDHDHVRRYNVEAFQRLMQPYFLLRWQQRIRNWWVVAGDKA